MALLGAVLLLFQKAKRTAFMLLLGSLALLFLLSIPAFQKPFLRYAESGSASPIPAKQTSAPIVVLGAGTRYIEGGSSSQSLGSTAIARCVEGIQLARQMPSVPLIFTGGQIGARPPSSTDMASLAIDLGVDPSRIITFSDPTSTAEEARRTFEQIGPATIYLVTSALHLPRAVELFKKEGLDPIPVPCDFLVDDSAVGFLDFLPSAEAWGNWQKLFHEVYGRIWIRIAN
ncbi:MAG: YdcF family protein [Verrucomicrobiota bacterium]